MMSAFHSIKNNAVVSIKTCADEPIRVPGAIQPHGFILVVDDEERIVFCSENAGAMMGCSNEQLLNQLCSKALGAELCTAVRKFIDGGKPNATLPTALHINGNDFDCFFRNAKQHFIIECIRVVRDESSPFNLMEASNEVIKLITPKTSLQEVCSLVANQIQQITGFSRVMIYRFDESYNGHVFAETVTDDQESFLGLNYPDTDIPPQARELYLLNLMRLIPDVNYAPVPVVTLNEALARPEALDMSNVHLRSVSPIHIQYLKNMGVGATLTISLIKEGRLWGLVACHHHKAMELTYARQTNALMIAQILNAQLIAQETAETYQLIAKIEHPLQVLMTKLSGDIRFTEHDFNSMPEVCEIVQASGAALLAGDKIWTNGIVPDQGHLLRLQSALMHKPLGWHTHSLRLHGLDAGSYAEKVAGILVFQLPSAPKPALLLFFRKPKNQVKKWAGKKASPGEKTELTPRTSFAAWQEIVEGESDKWLQPEINAGMRFMYKLQDNMVRTYLQDEESRMRELNNKLIKANSELENIHWISTHDLKEPLRKIQMFASMIDQREGDLGVGQVRASIDRIKSAALRMQNLIDDLLLYGKMSVSGPAHEMIDLNNVITEVCEAFKEEREEGILKVKVGNLAPVMGNKFQLQQLFINLIGNSVKFRKEGEPAIVKFGAEYRAKKYVITVCDTGIGFSADMNDKVFQVFTRGHNQPLVNGNGIGLSICKKIMDNHNGEITADGRKGEGACFTLSFPNVQAN